MLTALVFRVVFFVVSFVCGSMVFTSSVRAQFKIESQTCVAARNYTAFHAGYTCRNSTLSGRMA